MKSVGRVVNRTRTQLIAEAVVYDDQDNEIGRGSGIFVQSKMPLSDTMGYGSAHE